MNTAITFPKDNDLSGLRLEKTHGGHVVTPFFTFNLTEMEKQQGVYLAGARFHEIKKQAVTAFCGMLGLRPLQVLVSERKQPNGEIWWRLGSAVPCKIPMPKQAPKPVLPENRGAIDI